MVVLGSLLVLFIDFSVFSKFLNENVLPKTGVAGLEEPASKNCYRNVFLLRPGDQLVGASSCTPNG